MKTLRWSLGVCGVLGALASYGRCDTNADQVVSGALMVASDPTSTVQPQSSAVVDAKAANADSDEKGKITDAAVLDNSDLSNSRE